MTGVLANGRTVIHAGDGLKHVAGPPDVCKTPSPGGPVPIPYVNLAQDSDLAQGARTVTIAGNAVALASSYLSTSTGDEPGTAGGGIVSAKTKGKMKWGTTSDDVRCEGKGVARFMDITQHNGNTYNDAFQAAGGTGFAYADDFTGKCDICGKGPRQHRMLETPSTVDLCQRLIAELRKKKELKKRRFMVGVMVCKCGMTHAAMSGATSEHFGTCGVVDQIVGGAGASADDLIAVNASGKPGVAAKITEVFDEMATTFDRTPRGSGYNVPGTCAGAKLVAVKEHAPVHMTEMMFTSKSSWEGSYRLLKTDMARIASYPLSLKHQILQNKQAKWTRGTYRPDETVPSCHRCQQLLYLTNCPERSC